MPRVQSIEEAPLNEPMASPNRSGRVAAARESWPGASLLSLVVFDVGGPLGLYFGLLAAGTSTVVALVVSGILPAVGIVLGVCRHRRIDAIGVVVLAGILVGTIVGLASDNARLVLIDGTVPTVVLAVACFGSLATPRPLMFRVILQFFGADSPKGREFETYWQHRGFRHTFTVITTVWGAVFLAETIAQIVIVEATSASTAKTTANVLPIVVAGLAMAWTVLYGRLQQARAEREATTATTPTHDPGPVGLAASGFQLGGPPQSSDAGAGEPASPSPNAIALVREPS
jgi:hypothetical protein